MLNDKEVFSFELNELLYFNKGQEIAEMIGISLNPEISIQPFNDYVSIRGVIELKGEYVKSPSGEEEEKHVDLEDYHFRRYLEEIEEVEPDRAMFSHRFPVEISVPSYRVDNIEDITVNVETFDYSIPSHNELKLTSTIDIHGISEHTKELEENNEELLSEEPFEFELKQGTEDFEERDKGKIIDLPNDNDENELSDENNLTYSEDNKKEEKEETERWKYKETQTLSEFFEEKKPKKEQTEKVEQETKLEGEEQEGNHLKEEISKETTETEMHVPEEELLLTTEEHSDSTEVTEEKDLATVEDVSYLSDMFRNDEEIEPFTRMRVRIVQQDDTIKSIAETYDLSVIQLLNENKLDNEQIEEGQLLRIPQKQKIK